MARKCFNGWSDDELRRLTSKQNTDLISAEDLAEAIEAAGMRRNNAYRQSAILSRAATAIARGESGAKGLRSLLTRDPDERSGFLSAEQRINAIRSTTKAEIADFMDKMSPEFKQTFVGIATGERKLTPEQQKTIGDTVREIFGTQTGNADAQKFAKAWSKTNDSMVERFGDAGGDIRVRSDYYLPQAHSRDSLRKTSADKWVRNIWDKIDREGMKKKMRMKDATNHDLRQALHDSHHNIINGDLSLRPKQALKDKMKKERFISFKDGDSWLEYQAQYGEPNIYASMLGHIDTMSRDIGMMETFGPDPDAGFQALKLTAKTRDRIETDNPSTEVNRSQVTYDLLVGQNGVNKADQHVFKSEVANLLASVRNLRAASKLGGAVIAQASDVVFASQTAFYNGLPVMKTVKGMYKGVKESTSNPDSIKRQMADMGYGADYAIDRAFLSYDQMQTAGSTNTRLAAEAVMQASGMHHLTHSTRAGFQYEFTQGLSRATDLGWDELSKGMRLAMDRYGIGPDDWTSIRNSKKSTYKGEEILDPRHMDREIQTKFVGMVDAEMNMAIPTPDARTRSMMTFGQKQGTVMGELIRGATQFHSFNATILMNNMTRMIKGKAFSGNADRFAQIAGMMTVGTILGAVVVQSREAMSGKTLLDWDNPKLWKRAAAQSGMMPYLGDFYVKEAMGWNSTSLSGYVGGAPAEYTEFMLRALAADSDGKRAKLFADFATREIPFQNLWYSKLATDRLILDRIRRQADENYDKNQERSMRRLEENTGQKYWWKPPIGE